MRGKWDEDSMEHQSRRVLQRQHHNLVATQTLRNNGKVPRRIVFRSMYSTPTEFRTALLKLFRGGRISFDLGGRSGYSGSTTLTIERSWISFRIVCLFSLSSLIASSCFSKRCFMSPNYLVLYIFFNTKRSNIFFLKLRKLMQ